MSSIAAATLLVGCALLAEPPEAAGGVPSPAEDARTATRSAGEAPQAAVEENADATAAPADGDAPGAAAEPAEGTASEVSPSTDDGAGKPQPPSVEIVGLPAGGDDTAEVKDSADQSGTATAVPVPEYGSSATMKQEGEGKEGEKPVGMKAEGGEGGKEGRKFTPGPNVRAALMAPVERGALVYYGNGGFPELKVGFREGMDGFELGAELGFDYVLTDMWLVASARGSLWHDASRDFSLEGQLGAFGSFGSTGIEDVNKPGQGVRMQVSGFFSHAFSGPFLFTAAAKIPLEIPVSSCGLLRFGAMAGAGIEASLTDDFILSFNVDAGPMLYRPYGGVSYFRFAFDVNVGLGYRLF